MGLQVVEGQPLIPYFLEKCLAIPKSPFFHLLVNGFSVIREYVSTLYVGFACAVSPTNTNFQLTFFY